MLGAVLGRIIKVKNASYIAQAGMIAAIYAAATLACNLIFPIISWGPIQLRISEAICVVAAIFPSSIPGLTIGCVIANLINIFISGTGALGILDVVFGSLATLLGATLCWKFRSKPILAISMFVLSNALIVPAYLPIISQWTGFYTIPFTTISLDGLYIWMYLFGIVTVGVGEAITIFVLGVPLLKTIKSHLEKT